MFENNGLHVAQPMFRVFDQHTVLMIFAARFNGCLDDLPTWDRPFWPIGSNGLLGPPLLNSGTTHE
jgi:hypothetical protein